MSDQLETLARQLRAERHHPTPHTTRTDRDLADLRTIIAILAEAMNSRPDTKGAKT